jgi:hypothetical protein
LANFRKAATTLAAVAVGRNARTQWRAPLHAPQTARLALECFEQASILASLGVFELLPNSPAEIPDVIKEFLNADEKAFLDGIQNVYSEATALLKPATESAVTSTDQAFLKIQLEAITTLEASLASLRSSLESGAGVDNEQYSQPC